MRHLEKARLAALLVSASLVAAAVAHAQTAPAPAPQAAPPGTQAPAEPDDSVSEVTVTGTKLPDALATKSATCEALAEKDPSFRAMLLAATSGNNTLGGPRVYLPTRAPRNPDYRAAPLSQPGTPIPEVSARWRGPRVRNDGTAGSAAADTTSEPEATSEAEALTGADASIANGGSILASTFGGAGDASIGNRDGSAGASNDMSVAAAVSACRGVYVPGGSAAMQGRAEISGRDKTLPTGLTLFDEGRYEEALDYLQQAYRKLPVTDGGDEAALMIGKIYLFALREKSDAKQGVMWLKRAASVAFDPTKSMPVFDPTAPENNTAIGEAALLLGQLYLSGAAGVEKDPAEARKWFARSFEVGHVAAGKVLGDLYYAGIGGPKDLKKAFAEYKAAATLGHAPAQYALADLYYTGEYGGPADRNQALAWYNQAAKLEHPDALYALAAAYDSGDGVAADPKKAVALYKASALKGNVAAMTAMGTYFYQGDQVQKDDATARKWFQAAAAAGDVDAMFNLAAMMMNGQGGEVDRPKAWVWFKLSQAKGNTKAAAAIAALEKKMTAQERASAASLLAPKSS